MSRTEMVDPTFDFILFNASSAILNSKILLYRLFSYTALLTSPGTSFESLIMILTQETLCTHQFFCCFPSPGSNKMVKVVSSIRSLFIGSYIELQLAPLPWISLKIGYFKQLHPLQSSIYQFRYFKWQDDQPSQSNPKHGVPKNFQSHFSCDSVM